MPQLNGKKYAYTKEGIAKYKKDKERKKRFAKAEKLVGGKRFSDYPKVPKKKKKKYTLSEAKQKLKKMGRRGDTELEHVNKDEQRMLKRMGASRSKNPRTGLTENFPFGGGGGISISIPTPKINIPKSTGDIIPKSTGDIIPKSTGDVVKKIKAELPKGFDEKNIKGRLPKGIDSKNALDKVTGVVEGAGGFVTSARNASVNLAYNLLGGQGDYYDQGGGSSSTTTSSTARTASLSGGFGAMKKKKKKKGLLAEGEESGSNTRYGGRMSKRGLRTPKRTGLNIVKKNSSSTSLGM